MDWGDLKRQLPVCRDFGFSRGTPIDRYYLGKFIQRVRPEVAGIALEIGGSTMHAKQYRFFNAREYHALELKPSSSVDFVGDAHDQSVITKEFCDSIIAFNVLEHCAKPWVVVQNMHSWLKSGGKAFCMVPSAQRIHDLPSDYWRPLPSAMESLFEMFSKVQLHVYGNLLALTAAFHGIACEELDQGDLDHFHPDYPVATCVIADK